MAHIRQVSHTRNTVTCLTVTASADNVESHRFTAELSFYQAKLEVRLTSRESAQDNLSQSDEEFFQKAFRAYCLSEIHLHHMVSIELVTVSSNG